MIFERDPTHASSRMPPVALHLVQHRRGAHRDAVPSIPQANPTFDSKTDIFDSRSNGVCGRRA